MTGRARDAGYASPAFILGVPDCTAVRPARQALCARPLRGRDVALARHGETFGGPAISQEGGEKACRRLRVTISRQTLLGRSLREALLKESTA